MKEKRARSIMKGVTWRVLATLATIAIVLAFTGELILAVGVGAVEVISKLILYYFHERTWNLIRWGGA
ncbi:MAG: DUF2061 domain-containing protein [Candidatus Aenigmatarchaeota archaeon]